MAKYDLLLCDADMTLMDFHHSENVAFAAAARAFGFSDDQETYAVYKKSNSDCWLAFERGEITIPQLRIRRFEGFLKGLGREDVDPAAAAACYEGVLCRQSWTMPGAAEGVARWKQRAHVMILTNGITVVQHGRVSGSPFPELEEDMVISEEVGVSKPDPRIVEIAMEKAGVTEKSRVLLLGDSLTSDMKAAENAGVDSCWYNPKGTENTTGVRVTYEIRDLSEVDSLLS